MGLPVSSAPSHGAHCLTGRNSPPVFLNQSQLQAAEAKFLASMSKRELPSSAASTGRAEGVPQVPEAENNEALITVNS